MRRFSAAITAENGRGSVAVIPDMKRVSPKEGELMRGRNPVEAAKLLAGCGAPVLSVVTEKKHFGGSLELCGDIAKNAGVPVLRKDFITTEEELKKTADIGAAAVLLICALTDGDTLAALYGKALELGLEPLVEVCTAGEMQLAKKLGARLVGVNNRDIRRLEKDGGGPSRTFDLAPGLPEGAILISESGILSPGDVALALSAGANAVLVGTALWTAHDMAAAYRSLRLEMPKRGVSTV